MGNILNLASVNLMSIQQMISTAGHNIANANDPDYSRQVVSTSTFTPQRVGNNYVGNGVKIDSIDRMSDFFVNQQIQTHTSSKEFYATFGANAEEIDSLLANPTSNLSESLTAFYSAIQVSNNQPSDLPSRQALFTQSELLVSNLHRLSDQFTQINHQVNQQIKHTVNAINSIAGSIVDVNSQILGQSETAPDLLDRRDGLVTELSQLVGIKVFVQNDDTINVNIGNGQSLVVGGQAIPLVSGVSNIDSERVDISAINNGVAVVINNNISGGALGGILAYQDEILGQAMNTYGQMALTVAMEFNAQHQKGMDLNNAVNQNYFTDLNATNLQLQRAQSMSSNTGTAALAVSVNDVSQISSSDYRLDVLSGSNYAVTRLSDNTTTNFAGFPISVDGLNISINSGVPAVGDAFLLTPTRSAARNIALELTDIKEIALASPIRTNAQIGNTGSGEISAGSVSNINNASFATPGQLSPPLRVEFLTNASYQVVNATTSAVIEGPIAFTPGNSQALFPTPGSFDPGYRVDISGYPSATDAFEIQFNANGYNDNRNGLILGDIQNKKIAQNNTMSVNDIFSNLATTVGGKTNQAKVNESASDILYQQSFEKRQTISGVNIDQETADLLKYQQSYQAAAQLISTASRIFEILFDSLR